MQPIERSYAIVALSLLFPTVGLAQMEAKKAGSEPATHSVVLSNAVAFQPLEIPGFASGVKLAVIHGGLPRLHAL